MDDKQRTDAGGPVPRPWICSTEVWGENRYENGNKTTTTTTKLSISLDTKGLTSLVGHKNQ